MARQPARQPNKENVCIEMSEHNDRLLKIASIEPKQMPVWEVRYQVKDFDGEPVEKKEKMYILDDWHMQKIASHGWKVVDKRKTLVDGIFMAAIESENPGPRRGTACRPTKDQIALRKGFVDMCLKGAKKAQWEVEEIYNKAHYEFDSLSEEWAAARRKLKFLESTMAYLRDNETKRTKAKFEKDFDNILKIPKVVGMRIRSNNRFEVFTETLFCIDTRDGVEREIGRFRIVFDVAQTKIWFFNKDRRVEGHDENMHAPHVWSNGEPCLGTSEETFADLYAQHDYPALVSVAIQFIETANVEDGAGQYVNCWPVSKRSRIEQHRARAVRIKKNADGSMASEKAPAIVAES